MPVASNYYHSKWLAHPAQNNLYPLSKVEQQEIVNGFINRPQFDQIKNYQNWLDASFGVPFSQNFSSAYTRKYWTIAPEKLETSWVGNRVLQSDIDEIKAGCLRSTPVTKFYSKEMRYPEHGCFQAFCDGFAPKEHIEYNHRLVHLNTVDKKMKFSNGNECTYDTLLSTIPLPELIKVTVDAPQKVKQAAEKLTATSGLIVSIGLRGSLKADHLWFYVYDEDIPFARVYSPSLKSPNNAPDGCSSLQAEIYFSKHKPLTKSITELEQLTIKSLIQMGVIEKEQLIFAKGKIIKYANVIFTHDTIEARSVVHDWLKMNDIRFAGRFGEWDYLWSDQSTRSGLEAAKSIVSTQTI